MLIGTVGGLTSFGITLFFSPETKGKIMVADLQIVVPGEQRSLPAQSSGWAGPFGQIRWQSPAPAPAPRSVMTPRSLRGSAAARRRMPWSKRA